VCLSFASRDSPHDPRNLLAAVYVCVFATLHRARESLNPHHFVGKIDGARLYADVLTRLAALEETHLKLKEEVEQLQRAQAMARDPRLLRNFGVNVSGSNSRMVAARDGRLRRWIWPFLGLSVATWRTYTGGRCGAV